LPFHLVEGVGREDGAVAWHYCCVRELLSVSEAAYAEEIDFDRIDKFESSTTGTLRVGAPPKTIVDDGKRHVVMLTIWDADAETKVYWRSLDGNAPKTTIIPGKGIPDLSNGRRVQARGCRRTK
jgi:hypothetical protein